MTRPARRETEVIWELRQAWGIRRKVRLTLASGCLLRTIVGTVDSVAATGAFVVCDGWHIPTDRIEAIGRPTFNDERAYEKKVRSKEILYAINPTADAA